MLRGCSSWRDQQTCSSSRQFCSLLYPSCLLHSYCIYQCGGRAGWVLQHSNTTAGRHSPVAAAPNTRATLRCARNSVSSHRHFYLWWNEWQLLNLQKMYCALQFSLQPAWLQWVQASRQPQLRPVPRSGFHVEKQTSAVSPSFWGDNHNRGRGRRGIWNSHVQSQLTISITLSERQKKKSLMGCCMKDWSDWLWYISLFALTKQLLGESCSWLI